MFWFLMGIFLAIYAAFVIEVLIWCLLGAILNPEKFLAYAAGAGTLIAFVTSKVNQVKLGYVALVSAVMVVCLDALKS